MGGESTRKGRDFQALLARSIRAESDKLMAIYDQWFRSPKGKRVPPDDSLQLWLPVMFDPVTGVAKMQFVQEWDPWK